MAVARDGDLIGAFQGETIMLRPTALDHVGLKVTDMDRTLHFYQRLGLTRLRTSGPSAHGLRSAVIRVRSQELNIFLIPTSPRPVRRVPSVWIISASS